MSTIITFLAIMALLPSLKGQPTPTDDQDVQEQRDEWNYYKNICKLSRRGTFCSGIKDGAVVTQGTGCLKNFQCDFYIGGAVQKERNTIHWYVVAPKPRDSGDRVTAVFFYLTKGSFPKRFESSKNTYRVPSKNLVITGDKRANNAVFRKHLGVLASGPSNNVIGAKKVNSFLNTEVHPNAFQSSYSLYKDNSGNVFAYSSKYNLEYPGMANYDLINEKFFLNADIVTFKGDIDNLKVTSVQETRSSESVWLFDRRIPKLTTWEKVKFAKFLILIMAGACGVWCLSLALDLIVCPIKGPKVPKNQQQFPTMQQQMPFPQQMPPQQGQPMGFPQQMPPQQQGPRMGSPQQMQPQMMAPQQQMQPGMRFPQQMTQQQMQFSQQQGQRLAFPQQMQPRMMAPQQMAFQPQMQQPRMMFPQQMQPQMAFPQPMVPQQQMRQPMMYPPMATGLPPRR